MQFQDVLNYLEIMVGIELKPINDSNDNLVILNVDFEKRRYTVDKTSSTKKVTRTFSELKKVWDALNQKGFTNVDQALSGAGSSRHQPETIFANLPSVEHFKYEEKKHLYIKDVDTHPLGTLKELTRPEIKDVKRRIDKYRDFDISQFYHLHRKQTTQLKAKLEHVFIKYPGESDIDAIGEIIDSIQELETKLSEAIVNIDQTATSDSDDDSIVFGSSSEDEDEDDQGAVDFDSGNKAKGIVPTRITQVSPTVSLLFDRVLHNEIDLKPEYQRKDRIWPAKDRARLIESILLGLPLPAFYFAERANKDPNASIDFDWVVIDGLQRTTTLIDFMQGEFALKELKQLPQYETFKYKDLPRKEQRRIREYQIHGHLIQVSSDSEEMIREIFHRINTYGKNLSYQEIRSALYPGSASRYCKYFTSEDAFINGIPANVNPDRMLDIEFILRAISYLVLGYEKYVYKTNDDFLCQAMKVLNEHKYQVSKPINCSDDIYIDIDSRLRRALITITKIFGNGAYKKEENGKLNKVLFELLVSTFAMMSNEQVNKINALNNTDIIRDRLWAMIDEDEKTSIWESEIYTAQKRGFDYSISNSTGKRVTVLYRFRSLVNMLNEVANLNFSPKGLLENKNKEAGAL
jgi:uncharacterized protein with ParB-like and HNH nuclease domain